MDVSRHPSTNVMGSNGWKSEMDITRKHFNVQHLTLVESVSIHEHARTENCDTISEYRVQSKPL
jgi:hypothetical protein